VAMGFVTSKEIRRLACWHGGEAWMAGQEAAGLELEDSAERHATFSVLEKMTRIEEGPDL